MPDVPPRWPVCSVAVLFECLLGFVGLAIIWLIGLHQRHAFMGNLADNLWAFITGVAASAPMILAAFLLLASSWGPLKRVRLFVLRHVVPWFRAASVTDLALVAWSAGWGEELLFRGAIQTGLADWWGDEQTWLSRPGLGRALRSVALGYRHLRDPRLDHGIHSGGPVRRHGKYSGARHRPCAVRLRRATAAGADGQVNQAILTSVGWCQPKKSGLVVATRPLEDSTDRQVSCILRRSRRSPHHTPRRSRHRKGRDHSRQERGSKP